MHFSQSTSPVHRLRIIFVGGNILRDDYSHRSCLISLSRDDDIKFIIIILNNYIRKPQSFSTILPTNSSAASRMIYAHSLLFLGITLISVSSSRRHILSHCFRLLDHLLGIILRHLLPLCLRHGCHHGHLRPRLDIG
jgi:hypothetical protein